VWDRCSSTTGTLPPILDAVKYSSGTSGQRSKRLGTGGGGNWGSHLGGDVVSGGLDDGHLYLASSSEIEGVVLPSVSVRDLLGSITVSIAAANTSGNVNVATEVVGASAGERANLVKDSGGRENEEGTQGGKFEGVGRRGGLVTPQQLVKGRIGALWIGWTAEELEDLGGDPSVPESLDVSSLLGRKHAGSLGSGPLSSSSSFFPILNTSSAATSSSPTSSNIMDEAVEERENAGVKGLLVGSNLVLLEVLVRARRW